MRVFLTDDHPILREGLRRLLSTEIDMEVVGESGTVADTLRMLMDISVDVLVTDYNLPDADAISLIKNVLQSYPEMKIVVLSMHDEPIIVREVLKSGVQGYVLKKDSHMDLINAIIAAYNGKTYLSSDINNLLISGIGTNHKAHPLTDRELEILKLIAGEFTNGQIADKLFISERTVETHRKNIFRKTGTNNLVGLVKYAYANHLIT